MRKHQRHFVQLWWGSLFACFVMVVGYSFVSLGFAQQAQQAQGVSETDVSWLSELGDSIHTSSDLSVGSAKQYDDLTNEHSFFARTHLDSRWSQGPFSVNLFLWAQANSDVGFSPGEPFVIGLRQAYIGIQGDLPWSSYVGFATEDFLGSDVVAYTKSLPTLKAVYFYDAWEMQAFVSSIPYKKKDALKVSREVPYVAGVQMERTFDPQNSWFLNSLSLRWFGAGEIPSELAEEYALRGNSVIKGQYANSMAHSMSTLGARVVIGDKVTAFDELEASFEVLGNTMAPKEYAYALWGDVAYRRYFDLADQQSWVRFGAALFSIGEDAYLAEFGKDHLGYTGVEGYGLLVGFGQHKTTVEAGYYAYDPRHKNMYKRKTKLVKVTLTQKLW